MRIRQPSLTQLNILQYTTKQRAILVFLRSIQITFQHQLTLNTRVQVPISLIIQKNGDTGLTKLLNVRDELLIQMPVRTTNTRRNTHPHIHRKKGLPAQV